MNYLVTGAAGFIGSHVCQQLLAQGHQVFGIDNLNNYYDVSLKQARLTPLMEQAGFQFAQIDVSDRQAMADLFQRGQFQRVIHLAAQAGVRYSLDNPMAYADSNLTGFVTVLEGCRHHHIQHLVFASSSSVYGLNAKMPFSTTDDVDHPVSLYAATKKSNELMAHAYAHLYGLPVTGLRFFTVYGPWGRPDMALFKFTRAMLDGQAIDVYNQGNLSRDFTYVDDIVEGVLRIADHVPQPDPAWNPAQGTPRDSSAPYRIYNIGNGSPVKLLDFIQALEQALGITAKKNMLPMQAGDVYATWADTADLFAAVGYKPAMSVEEGVRRFVDWYQHYYHV